MNIEVLSRIKKNWWIPVLLAALIGIVVWRSGESAKAELEKAEKAKAETLSRAQLGVFKDFLREVDNFHEKLEELSSNSNDVKTLQNEATRLKRIAANSAEKTRQFDEEADKFRSKSSVRLDDAIKKSAKYFSSYSSFVDGKPYTSTVRTAGRELMSAIRAYPYSDNLSGLPGMTDVERALTTTKQLMEQLNKARRIAARPKPTPQPRVVIIRQDNYDSRPSFSGSGRMTDLATLWYSYKQSRGEINSVFKRGSAVSPSWESVFDYEIQRRREISESLDGIIPNSVLERDLKNILRNQADGSVAVLIRYRYNPSYENGQAISDYSNDPDNIRDLATLKRYL